MGRLLEGGSVSTGGGIADITPLGGFSELVAPNKFYRPINTSVVRSQYPEMSEAFPDFRAAGFVSTSSTLPWGTSSIEMKVLAGGGLYLAVDAESRLAISSDGKNWIDRSGASGFVPTSETADIFTAFYANGEWLVYVNNVGLYVGNKSATSWEQSAVSSFAKFTDIDYDPASGTYGGCNNVGHVFITTGDPVDDWVDNTLQQNSSLDAIAANGNVWITVGEAGLGFRSTDGGQTWTDISANLPSGDMDSIAFGNGAFVLYESGSLYRSIDNGDTWTRVAESLSGNDSSLDFRGEAFFLATSSGDLAVSVDGASWQRFDNAVAGGVADSAGSDYGVIVAQTSSAGAMEFVAFETEKNILLDGDPAETRFVRVG